MKRYLVEHGYADLGLPGAKLGMGHVHGYPYPRADVVDILRLEGYLKFAVVRDPYSRIWSCYVDKILRNRENNRPLHVGFARYNRLLGIRAFNLDMDFPSFLKTVARIPDWMADGHFRSQHRFIASHRGALLVDRLARLENLDTEMLQLTIDRELPPWDAPNLNPSKAGALSFEWTRTELNLVNRRYAADFRLLSYAIRNSG